MWIHRLICIVLVWQLLVACTTPTTQISSIDGTKSTAVPGQIIVSSGFDPKKDGFSFQNYGEADVTNLTNADMQRMFGDAVCASTQPDCTLIPAAQVWMEEINRAMSTGHCEGMAVLSQYFYYGVIKPQTFGGANAAALDLAKNLPLQREIAYWWATQATYPTRGHHTIADANTTIALLRDGLNKNAQITQLYTLGMYTLDHTDGHTVTPIALRDIDATHVAIQIYDNNFPETTQEIVVDTTKNSWQYTPSTGDNTVLYSGDATSKSLDLTATSPRLEKQLCNFCPGNPIAKGLENLTTILFSSTSTKLTTVSTQMSAYFVDLKGNRSGVVLGQVYNEIPNAYVDFLRGSENQWSQLGMPMISVPADVVGSIRVTGATDKPINVTAFGAGNVVSVQDLAVDEKTASDIRLDQAKGTAAVASATDTRPNLIVGYSDGQKNVKMTIQGVRISKGDKVAMAADRDNDNVSVLTTQPQQVEVRVTVENNDPAKPPRDTQQTQPADDQRLAPISDGMAPAPVVDDRKPPREEQRTPQAGDNQAPNDTSQPNNNPPQGTPPAGGTDPRQTPNSNNPRPTPSAGGNGNPQSTQPANGNGNNPRPTPPANGNGNGNGNPQPTQPANDNGGGNGNPQPTQPANGNGGGNGNPQPTQPANGNGGGNGNPQPTQPANGNGGGNGNPQPTQPANGNGNPQPTQPANGNGNGNPQPTQPSNGNGGGNGNNPKPTKPTNPKPTP